MAMKCRVCRSSSSLSDAYFVLTRMYFRIGLMSSDAIKFLTPRAHLATIERLRPAEKGDVTTERMV